MEISSDRVFLPKGSNSSRADLRPVRCSAFPVHLCGARAAHVPPGVSELLSWATVVGVGQCGKLEGWNFLHDEVKANFMLPVRQPKMLCVICFSRGTKRWSQRTQRHRVPQQMRPKEHHYRESICVGTARGDKLWWGEELPPSINRLPVPWKRTICVYSKMPREACFPSSPDQACPQSSHSLK